MGLLQTDTAVRDESGVLTATLSRDWEIWGPNGGYVAAIALRAAGAVAPPDHRPATFTCQYLSVGKFEDAVCEVTPVKQGRNAWLLNVVLRQGEKAFLQAQIWTTNKAEGPARLDAVMPDVPRPGALKTIEEHLAPEAPPRGFWRNFGCKPVAFRRWGQPSPPGPMREWYSYPGLEMPDAFLDAARSVILIDTMVWPAFARALPERPNFTAPSLDLTVWFHAPAPDAEWLLVDSLVDVAQGGLIHGQTRTWTEDGRLVATGGSNLMHVAPR